MAMESLLKDPSITPNKPIKNSKRKNHHLHHHHNSQVARLPSICRQTSSNNIIHQKLAPHPHVQLEMMHAAIAGGVFLNHFPQQFSHSSLLPPILPTYYQHHAHNINQKPPLLPLPPLTRRHTLSTPDPRKQPTKPKHISAATISISISRSRSRSRSNKELVTGSKDLSNGSLLKDEVLVAELDKEVKPEPGKKMTRVLPRIDLENEDKDDKKMEKLKTFSSIFILSPPPSSLPLPRFPLKKMELNKLRCNAEAAAAAEEVNMGATDNLCRLLKLR